MSVSRRSSPPASRLLTKLSLLVFALVALLCLMPSGAKAEEASEYGTVIGKFSFFLSSILGRLGFALVEKRARKDDWVEVEGRLKRRNGGRCDGGALSLPFFPRHAGTLRLLLELERVLTTFLVCRYRSGNHLLLCRVRFSTLSSSFCWHLPRHETKETS